MTHAVTTTDGPPAAAGPAPVLAVRGLTVRFPGPDGDVQAVRGIDLAVHPGEVLGVVGESGSGKSVTMLAVMGLLPAYARITGAALLQGEDLVQMGRDERRRRCGRDIAMVFQDPMTSLNPVFTIGNQVVEAIRVHQPGISRTAARRRALELLTAVGIPGAARRLDDYPHQFSGGMRQRVVIAMAVANDPAVLIADEPTTALDVTVQAQILELLQDLCQARGIAVVLISHDLGVVSGLTDRVAVMYAGRVVEQGDVTEIFYRSAHPYTRGLLAAVPRITATPRPLRSIPGTPPSLLNPPPGCAFAARCEWRTEECRHHDPSPRQVGGVVSACLRADEVMAQPADPERGDR